MKKKLKQKLMEALALDIAWNWVAWVLRINWIIEESAIHVSKTYVRQVWRNTKTDQKKIVEIPVNQW